MLQKQEPVENAVVRDTTNMPRLFYNLARLRDVAAEDATNHSQYTKQVNEYCEHIHSACVNCCMKK